MFNQNFTDQELQCADCGQGFTFSAEDQEFYAQKRYSTPKRCASCRANRKANDSRGGGGGYGGGGRGGYGGGSSRPQFSAVCAGCGIETTVPFEPKGDRPVYCSDCFRNNR
ncbi:MAG: CxxC-x17-CxxC domain-containing protein [bacterium]